ncbi:MAG: nucleotidyl transferase AbiEii/AbiGii toxin family protein [Elusimicrobia bacterium]|nr:nucleotidyl transferase AbiEii/AbiGii toxin family protein [Elusimicrobiota bacterium]
MINQLLNSLARELDKKKVPYMIIGGQAVLLYGNPRLTRDIDITLGIDSEEHSKILDIITKLKLRVLVKDEESFVSKTRVLPCEDTEIHIRVDFIFSFTPYESQAIKRAIRVKIDKYNVRFASKEDVIVHKMFAGRPIDAEDVKGILIRYSATIDFDYIIKWLKEFETISKGENLVRKFNNLRKEIGNNK